MSLAISTSCGGSGPPEWCKEGYCSVGLSPYLCKPLTGFLKVECFASDVEAAFWCQGKGGGNAWVPICDGDYHEYDALRGSWSGRSYRSPVTPAPGSFSTRARIHIDRIDRDRDPLRGQLDHPTGDARPQDPLVPFAPKHLDVGLAL